MRVGTAMILVRTTAERVTPGRRIIRTAGLRSWQEVNLGS